MAKQDLRKNINSSVECKRMPHSRIEKNVRTITSHFHREKLEQSFKFEGDRFAGTDGAASNTMRVERHQSRNEGLKVHSHPVLERVDVRYDFAPCCRIVTIAPWRPAVLAGRAEPVQIRQVHRALPIQPDSVPNLCCYHHVCIESCRQYNAWKVTFG